MQLQLFQAAVDQALHGELGGQDEPAAVAASLLAVHGLPAPPAEGGAQWGLRFSHLVGYAGCYYAYPYAQCAAAHLWEAHFAADPLARHAGDRLRRELLARGCGQPPDKLLSAVLGAEAAARALRPHAPAHTTAAAASRFSASPSSPASGVVPDPGALLRAHGL